MKNKSLLVIVVLVLVSTLVFSCTSSTPSPTSTPTTAPTTSAPATSAPATSKPATTAVQPIVLKYGTWTVKDTVAEVAGRWFIDELEKRSNGRVKFEHYVSGSLAPGEQLLDAIKTGIADAAMLNANYYPGKLPLMSIGVLPPYPISLWATDMAYWKLSQEIPEVQKELDSWNAVMLSPTGTTGYCLITKQPVAQLSDLKGLKLRALGNNGILLKELAGVVGVNMLYPEVYEAIQKGTLDGSIGGPTVITTYSLQEIAKNYFELPVGGITYFLGMSKSAFAKLPADMQAMIKDPKFQDEAITAYTKLYAVDGDGKGMAKMLAAGVKVTTPTAAEIAKDLEVCKEFVWKNWIADMEKKGLPGQKVADAYMKYNEDFAKLDPFKK